MPREFLHPEFDTRFPQFSQLELIPFKSTKHSRTRSLGGTQIPLVTNEDQQSLRHIRGKMKNLSTQSLGNLAIITTAVNHLQEKK